MDPMNPIQQEMTRRGLAGIAGRSIDPGFYGAIDSMADRSRPMGQLRPRLPQPGVGVGLLDTAMKFIPKVSAVVNAVNAGPVADGTLDYARRMGWVR